ncbi:MAG: PadR family transcriptional regulator [Bryobacteraceae bacterium]
MARGPNDRKERLELAYGSLHLLVLRTLVWGPTHGHGIAKSIERTSDDVFRVDHGSLYPALQRLLQEGWIRSEWGVTENKQRAKYYHLTPSGRKKLAAETSRWERFARAVAGVLRTADERNE